MLKYYIKNKFNQLQEISFEKTKTTNEYLFVCHHIEDNEICYHGLIKNGNRVGPWFAEIENGKFCEKADFVNKQDNYNYDVSKFNEKCIIVIDYDNKQKITKSNIGKIELEM